MKNPLKYLKHIVKDPINTIAEADARKKEIMPLLYVSAGILLVGVILQVALNLDFMAIFSFIGLAGVVFCLFLFSVIKGAKQRFEALTCAKCNTLAELKTKEAFDKYISYAVVKNEAKYEGYKGSKEPSNGVYTSVKFTATSSAIVAVKFTCPHCGEVKQLEYHAQPFKCHAEERNVGQLQFAAVRASLETAVKTAVSDYNNSEKHYLIPYTYHSSKNPNFENRYSFKGSNGAGAHPDYMGAKIDYRKDIEEMLEHYFVVPELNGKMIDPTKAKKK